jgi:hypothetical protein
VAGYGQGNGGWVLIASPLASDVNPEDVNGLCTNAFDLYRFNQGAELEWENWKSQANNDDHYHFDLENGRGYLYATQTDTILRFSGILYDGDGEVTLTKTGNVSFEGWNLIGNPFGTAKTLGSKPFYRMNDLGTEIIATETSTVAAMEGIFVVANTNGETVTFAEPTRGDESEERIIINLCNNAAVIDRAIVRLGEGETLPKFQMRDNSTKIYIPQGGEEYAIASVSRDVSRNVSSGKDIPSVGDVSRNVSTNEVPVHFKASENGTYAISVNVDNMEMGYLHLIDNLTGADIDLLDVAHNVSTAPSYTFTAKTTDYASRFRLVFAPVCGDADDDNEAFAFISNGNIIVNGTGMLQVVDVMGRIIVSRDGVHTVSTTGMTPGVYVLRLINENDIKVQKIVVR